MKKLLTLVFAFIALSTISNAQIGIKAGLNLASISASSEDGDIEPDNTIAFHIGATYAVTINENMSFRPGALFSVKGYKVNFGNNLEFKGTYSYIEIPLDFVYKTGALDIHSGPYLGLLMSAKIEDEDVKEELESLDYGLNFGLTYNINTNIGVGLNYGLGLANTSKNPADGESIKNKVIGISIVYSL